MSKKIETNYKYHLQESLKKEQRNYRQLLQQLNSRKSHEEAYSDLEYNTNSSRRKIRSLERQLSNLQHLDG